MLKKLLACLLILMTILMSCGACAELRGYVKGSGYVYVTLGEYPYEKDGTIQPVLWRILTIDDENYGFLLTEYIIDTCQVINETDQKVIDAHSYRRISDYSESDIYVTLNTTVIQDLFSDSGVIDTLRELEGKGKLIIPTSDEFLTAAYGFSHSRWDPQPSHKATGTPYAIKVRGLWADDRNYAPYWANEIKDPRDYKLQLVGYDGHLSYGAYTRVNVGIRPAVWANLDCYEIESGEGTKKSPYVLVLKDHAPGGNEN